MELGLSGFLLAVFESFVMYVPNGACGCCFLYVAGSAPLCDRGLCDLNMFRGAWLSSAPGHRTAKLGAAKHQHSFMPFQLRKNQSEFEFETF